MNRTKIVSEMNKYMKKVSPNLECENDKDLTLFYKDEKEVRKTIAWFEDFDSKQINLGALSKNDEVKEIIEKDVIKIFYEKGKELLKKQEKKYTIQVIRNDDSTYVNFDKNTDAVFFDDWYSADVIKTAFTQKEIEALKQRQDVAIDWNKAIIKEASDDE